MKVLTNIVNIGPQLASKIPSTDIRFKPFWPVSHATLNEIISTNKELLTNYRSITAWKVSRYGVISGPYSVQIQENTDQK